MQDRDGGRLVAQAVRLFGPPVRRLALVWADAAYAGALVDELREQFGWKTELPQAYTNVMGRQRSAQ